MTEIKMDPALKAEWVEALRSGEYTQGTGRLRNDEGGRCCLGVLCDIAAAKGLGYWVQKEGDGGAPIWQFLAYGKGDEIESGEALPPSPVSKWAFGSDEQGYGKTDNPTVPAPSTCPDENCGCEPGTISLAELNDGGASFAEIAALIEEYL